MKLKRGLIWDFWPCFSSLRFVVEVRRLCASGTSTTRRTAPAEAADSLPAALPHDRCPERRGRRVFRFCGIVAGRELPGRGGPARERSRPRAATTASLSPAQPRRDPPAAARSGESVLFWVCSSLGLLRSCVKLSVPKCQFLSAACYRSGSGMPVCARHSRSSERRGRGNGASSRAAVTIRSVRK
jgi:hypothetical protein